MNLSNRGRHHSGTLISTTCAPVTFSPSSLSSGCHKGKDPPILGLETRRPLHPRSHSVKKTAQKSEEKNAGNGLKTRFWVAPQPICVGLWTLLDTPTTHLRHPNTPNAVVAHTPAYRQVCWREFSTHLHFRCVRCVACVGGSHHWMDPYLPPRRH